MTNREQLLRRLFSEIDFKEKPTFQEFKKCFDHISVFEGTDKSNPGNSRYVFLGMYGFRGFLAGLCKEYISGNGKQLQQYLGNIFSQARLENLFDELQLVGLANVHENLKIESYKHVFAQAYLGFVLKYASDDFLRKLAYAYFLNGTEHLLPKAESLNVIQLLKLKARSVFNQKVEIKQRRTEDGLFHSEVLLDGNQLIGSHSSKSKTYAAKKAVKLALKYVLDTEAELPENIEMAKKRAIREENEKLREKAKRRKAHEAKTKAKQEERAVIRVQKKKEAKEREYRRVINKSNAKNRSKNQTEKEKILEMLADPNLNPSKRRYLEDKLK